MKNTAGGGNTEGLRFHPEAPLTEEELERLDQHRLDPVIRVASGQLLDWFTRLDAARSGVGEPPPAMVMGILGGLGQGKSTVLHAVLRQMESCQVSRNLGCCLGAIFPSPASNLAPGTSDEAHTLPSPAGGRGAQSTTDTERNPTVHGEKHISIRHACSPYWRWFPRLLKALLSAMLEGILVTRPPRTLRIDTSLTNADQIEHKLFSLLLFPHLTWGVIRATALLLLLVWGLPHLLGLEALLFQTVDGMPSLGGFAVVAVLLPLLIALWSTGRELGKDWYGNFLDVFVLKAARFLLVTPELLVIDDLDRAKVEQQRAVLRALYKHARMLDCAVVVCFDERELLASKADPDPPEELLRKVLNYAVRIPPRTKEDALLLATGICADWVMRNRAASLAAVVAAPLFAADLARISWLLGQPGPRRIKDLLAQAVMLAVPRGVDRQDDFSALLRLAALYQVLPEAGEDSERLIRMLENNRKEAFDAELAGLGDNEDKVFMARREKGDRLLQRTRAMQPVKTGWRLLIGQDSDHRDQKVAQVPVLQVPVAEGWRPAMWRLERDQPRAFCLDVGKELERVRAGYGPKPFVQVAARETAFGEYGEGASDEAAVGMFILSATVEESPEARLSLYRYWLDRLDVVGKDVQVVCLPACLREWLADADVWKRLSQLEKQTLLARIAPATPTEFIETAALLIAAEPADFPLLFRFLLEHFNQDWDRDLAAALLRATTPTLQAEDLQGLDIPENAHALLVSAWPPLQPEASNPLGSVHLPLQALGRLQLHIGKGLLPDGVHAGLRSHAPFNPGDWLAGLQGLLRPGGVWRLDYWHDTWRGTVPARLKVWIAGGFEPEKRLDKDEYWLVVFALCLADEDWDGLDVVMKVAGKLGFDMQPVPGGGAYPVSTPSDLQLAIAGDFGFIDALSTCTWFWLDQVPSPDVGIRMTRQGRVLAVIPQGQFRERLGPLHDMYQRHYEEIEEIARQETQASALAVAARSGAMVIPGKEADRRRFIQAMYETYFRDWDLQATPDSESATGLDSPGL